MLNISQSQVSLSRCILAVALLWLLGHASFKRGLALSDGSGRMFEVLENTGPAVQIGQLFLSGGNAFTFTDDTACGNFFNIDSLGIIRTTNVSLDREQILAETMTDELHCLVQYINSSDNSLQMIEVTITILDINDQTPMFFDLDHPVHEIEVLETISPGSPILTLQPVDNDKGLNGTVSFGIIDGNDGEFFRLDRAPGSDPSSPIKYLYVEKPLGTDQKFNLTITISDMGEPEPRSSTQYVEINILEGNIYFISSDYDFLVPEDHPVGSDVPIGNVTVHGGDGHELYSLFTPTELEVLSFFAVEPHTGSVFLLQNLDYEDDSLKRFTFDIVAHSNSSNQSTRAAVMVDIIDVNDEPPYFTEAFQSESINHVQLSVPENLLGTDIPYELLRLQVRDSDTTIAFQTITNITSVYEPPVDYFHTEHISFFGVILLYLDQVPDSASNITLHLTAYDNAFNNATITVLIYVPAASIPVQSTITLQTTNTVHKSVDQSSLSTLITLSTLISPSTSLPASGTSVSLPPAVHGGDDPIQSGTSQEILIIATILPTVFVSVSFFILGVIVAKCFKRKGTREIAHQDKGHSLQLPPIPTQPTPPDEDAIYESIDDDDVRMMSNSAYQSSTADRHHQFPSVIMSSDQDAGDSVPPYSHLEGIGFPNHEPNEESPFDSPLTDLSSDQDAGDSVPPYSHLEGVGFPNHEPNEESPFDSPLTDLSSDQDAGDSVPPYSHLEGVGFPNHEPNEESPFDSPLTDLSSDQDAGDSVPPYSHLKGIGFPNHKPNEESPFDSPLMDLSSDQDAGDSVPPYSHLEGIGFPNHEPNEESPFDSPLTDLSSDQDAGDSVPPYSHLKGIGFPNHEPNEESPFDSPLTNLCN